MAVAVPPDAEGFILLESIGVRLRIDGQQLLLQVAETGEVLHTVVELTALRVEAEQARTAAEQRATSAEAELARLQKE